MNLTPDIINSVTALTMLVTAIIALVEKVLWRSSENRYNSKINTRDAPERDTETNKKKFLARYMAAQALVIWAFGILIFIMFSSSGGQPLTGWSGGMLVLAVIQIVVALKLREDA